VDQRVRGGPPLNPLPALPSLRFGLVVRVFSPPQPCPVPLRTRCPILEFPANSPIASGGGFSRNFRGLIEREEMRSRSPDWPLTTAVSRIRKRSTAQAFFRPPIAGATASPSPRSASALVRVSRREMKKGQPTIRSGRKLGITAAQQTRFSACWIWDSLRGQPQRQAKSSGKLEAMLDQLPANRPAVLQAATIGGLSIARRQKAWGVDQHTQPPAGAQRQLASLRAELA